MPCHAFGKSKYQALGKPLPPVEQYTPEALREVRERFRRHGLSTLSCDSAKSTGAAMFTVTIGDEMLEKLRAMLEDEDEEICVRLREYKVGGG